MRNGAEKLPILKSKRCFDIVMSACLLILLSPFILCTLLILKLEQIFRGRFSDPLFYSEIRLSHGNAFTLYKFNIFKQENIERLRKSQVIIDTKTLERNGGITYTGNILRLIYMDELPQLFNVLRGDMSFVGPRPVNPAVYKMHIERGEISKRLVPAGLTGHHQCQKEMRGDGVKLDEEYVRFYSENRWYSILLFDIKIILRTIKFVAKAQGI